VIHAFLNLVFVLLYCLKLQYSDQGYNHWRQRNSWVVGLVLVLTATVSFKTFRLLYSRLFGIPKFSAQIDDKLAFTKKV
jgi:hypothetical protein